jgi:hypothetical protein
VHVELGYEGLNRGNVDHKLFLNPLVRQFPATVRAHRGQLGLQCEVDPLWPRTVRGGVPRLPTRTPGIGLRWPLGERRCLSLTGTLGCSQLAFQPFQLGLQLRHYFLQLRDALSKCCVLGPQPFVFTRQVYAHRTYRIHQMRRVFNSHSSLLTSEANLGYNEEHTR